MRKNEKLILGSLEIKSFITEIDNSTLKGLKGGLLLDESQEYFHANQMMKMGYA